MTARLTSRQVAMGFAIGIPLVLAAAVGTMEWFENPVSSWPSGEHLRQAPEAAQGWLPDWVPVEATDIKEVHNIDINAVWVRFKVPAPMRELVKTSRPLAWSEIGDASPPPWWAGMGWPSELRHDAPANTPRSLAYYGSPDGRFCIATDSTSTNFIYAWTCN